MGHISRIASAWSWALVKDAASRFLRPWGEYRGENLGTIDFGEPHSVSGDMAEQIANVLDGSSVEIRGI